MNGIDADISRWHAEHPGKFETWVHSSKDIVYNTALGIMLNEADAEDITQDVLLSLYKKAPSFREESKVSTWLYRITVNRCIDVQRKKNRKIKWWGKQDKTDEDEAFHFEHPGVLVEKQEHAKALFAALKKIPQDQRAAYVLHKMEDKSMQEIADILNRSTSAVESLLSRANQGLRSHLKTYYESQLK